jgi:DNA-binding CsgD family transcriptional regulator
MNEPADRSENALSEREIEILRLVATGAANKEIALKLSISPNTVKVHLRRIFGKIGVASRTEATLFAIRSGIVPREVALLDEQAGADGAEDGRISPLSQASQFPSSGAAQGGLRGILQALRAAPRTAYLLAGALVLLVAVVGGLTAYLLRPTPGQNPPSSANAPVVSSVQRWQSLGNLKTPRRGMAAVSSEDALYLIGGTTPAGISGAALRFLPLANRWEELSPKPTPVTEVQAAMLGEKIYIPGGQTSTGMVTNIFEVFDPRRNQWEQRSPLPEALSGYALAAFEGRLYLFGGWNGKEYSAAVYAYDPAQDTWQPRPSLKSPRAFSTAVAGRDRIYVIGGFDGTRALDSNLVFYPNRGQGGDPAWEERAPLPKARYAMGAAALANLVFLVGGASEPDVAKDSITEALPLVEYVPPSDQWVSLEIPSQAVGIQPAVVTFGNYLHIFGGESKTGISPGHQTYQAIYTIGIPVIKDE